jgi:actin-related protein
MSDITGAVVIDSGSGFIKAGLAHHDFPTVCTPNVLLERTQGNEIELGQKLYGKEALKIFKQSG